MQHIVCHTSIPTWSNKISDLSCVDRHMNSTSTYPYHVWDQMIIASTEWRMNTFQEHFKLGMLLIPCSAPRLSLRALFSTHIHSCCIWNIVIERSPWNYLLSYLIISVKCCGLELSHCTITTIIVIIIPNVRSHLQTLVWNIPFLIK